MGSYVSKELLDELQKLFPNRLPTVHIPPESIGLLMGQQKVIAYLQNQYRVQNPLNPNKYKE